MCGIVAIYGGQLPIVAPLLQKAVEKLHHRGPDQQRTWVNTTGNVGLGHARLSIIDLETGDQPIANESGKVRIIVNGEFYDYERIQADLEDQGHYLRTRSDSEIALHLYEDLGALCLQQLRGEFAFVLWDETNQLLFAARDRFGIKPLFYTQVDGVLYLASEIKALFAAGVPAYWDQESLYQHLSLCMDQDRTLFQGIFQVPPGHYLLATNNRVQIMRYWDFDYPLAENFSGTCSERSEAECTEQLDELLREAVRVRLRADVPVGCFLSGGLDSSAILGMAARQVSGPLQAFTVAFNHPAYNEEPIARRTIEHVGALYHPLTVTHEDFAETIEAATWHAEMLGYNAHALARFQQSRAAHKAGYKVVISGDGADEIFAGYIYSRLDALLSNTEHLSEKARQHMIEELCRSNPAFRDVMTAQDRPALQRMLGWTPAWLRAMQQSRAPLKTLYARDFLSAYEQRDVMQLFCNKLDMAQQLAGRAPVVQSLYLWAKSFLPNQVLFADRMEMAHAVEVRMPFLDHHVVEFVRSLPVTFLIKGGVEKYILRQAARPYLTEEVYTRPKHPFTAPHTTLDLNNRFYQLMQEVLRSKLLGDLPFFEQKSVVALLDKLPQMPHRQRISYDSLLLMLLGMCLLQKVYQVGVV